MAAAPAATEGRPDPIGAAGLRPGGVTPRVGAWLVDSEIVGLLTLALWVGLAGRLDPLATPVFLALTFTAASFAYFVLLWSGDARATFGMRVFRLKVGHAFDGAVLTPTQAARRWLALGGPIPLLYGIPGLGGIVWLAALAWGMALLLSTSRSATRQGPHDRFAGSIVVGPPGWSISAFGCLVVALLMVVVPIVVLFAVAVLVGVLRELLSGIAAAA